MRRWQHDETPPEYKCMMCGELCEVVEEEFDYSGTHCTYGQPGTHKTGEYVSRCCASDYEEA